MQNNLRFQCPRIALTDSPNTASASACAFRTIATSSTQKPVVDWFEIISENYMVDGGRPLHSARQILEQYRVVQHGVSMYFGSAEPLEPRASAPAQDAGPAHQNAVAVRSPLLGQRRRHATPTTCCPCPTPWRPSKPPPRRSARCSDFLEVPIAVENVSSYAEFHDSEMTEWEFLNEVVERADCGILLDVNNIYVSLDEPQLRSARLRRRGSRRARGADPHRRPLAVTRNTSSTRTTIR